MNNPWFKFYPTDWRAEPRLRMCSLAARGLWIDLMAYMHEGQPYGHLTINGVIPDLNNIAALVARPLGEVKKALSELESKQVFSRSESGAIVSRRMVKDHARSEGGREQVEKRWALAPPPDTQPNRSPNRSATVTPITQKLEARTQKPEPEDNSSRLPSPIESKSNSFGDEKREKPPKHCQTSQRSGRVYVVKGTPEWDGYAADYLAVRGEEPAVNSSGGRWFKLMGEAEKCTGS